jgi:parallel beta-helix repeat protein
LCARVLQIAVIFLIPSYASGVTIPGGTISTDTTWTLAQSPYIVTGNVTVQGADGPDGVTTLTIEPGVEVRVNPGMYLYVGGTSGNPGALHAIGSEAQPILFTSSQTNPWYGIHFRDTANDPLCVMEHCVIEKAASQSIRIDSASPSIRLSNIQKNGNYGILISSGSPELTGNTISSNSGYGVYVIDAASKPVIVSNTFTNNGSYPIHILADYSLQANTYTGNGVQAVEIPGGTIAKDSLLKNAGIPYHITGTLTVQGTDGADGITTLAIEPGATLKFKQQMRLYIGGTSGAPGALQAVGAPDNFITFTSVDDSLWYGIWFRDTTSDATSTMDCCIIEKSQTTNITMESAGPTITRSIVRYCSDDGIYVTSGSPTISDTLVSSNGRYGLRFAGASSRPVIERNTFTANGSFPLRIAAGVPIYNNIFAGNIVQSVEIIGETLTADTVWKNIGASYVITGTITVQGTDGPDGITTFTIESGSELLFAPNSFLYVGGTSGSPGSLRATGDSRHPVLFTASSANWGGVNFRATADDATCLLDYCIVEKAINYNVYINSANPVIRHSTIRNGISYGIYVTSGAPTVSDCVIQANATYGLYNATLAYRPLISGNVFMENGSYPLRIGANTSLPKNSFINNAKQLIEVVGETVTLDNTWKNMGIPYYVSSNTTVQGTDGTDGITTLTIEPGTEIRFNQNIYLYIGNSTGNPGALSATGDENHPVVFTSNQANPWGGIYFRNTTNDSLSVLDYCVVEKANICVRLDSASPRISSSVVSGGYNAGIYLNGTGCNSAVIECSTIRNNPNGIQTNGCSGMLISNNNIVDNTSYGIQHSSTTALNASHNWWGRTAGPGASGCMVSGNVVTAPFLISERDCDILPVADDTDYDGISDTWELQYFGDLSQTGEGDYDNDGLSNELEFIIGSAPNDVNQVLPENFGFEYDGAGRIKRITRGQ